ncbi:MAG: RsbRD N-terminal domain-containing protein [Proteobacteria bacterium]|nr:RsbRD N-terminal domain-containing protein [Pseudomonadota bacterium]
MSLKNLLLQKRSRIVKKWRDVILQTYHEQSQGFLKKKDSFGNPVGCTISEGIESLYDALLEDSEDSGSDKISEALDSIMKVRAIQDFSPSRAVGFVFGLKKVIREELGNEILQNGSHEEWAAFDARIDGLGLLGFDIYANCRQKISDIRVNEVRTRSYRLLQMAGLSYDLSEHEGDPNGEKKEDGASNGQHNMEAREH